MKQKSVISLLFLMLLMSCSEEINIDPNNFLIGIWTYAEYQDGALIFNRNSEFIDDRCYEFKIDGTLTSRQISGWCATPPVSYANYPGTWTILNDTLVLVNTDYWGGDMTYTLAIESVDSRILRTRVIYEP
ncbi:MAG: hypothetical protein OEY56_01045 [Cyclobacteriaceae bacterium]|nr:hypothetical protein [Cyclobacteriaceae bacterium]